MIIKEELEVYKLKLEAYRGNKELGKIYMALCKQTQNHIILRKEMEIIRENIEFIDKTLKKIPNDERNVIYDAYLNDELSIIEILKKYKISNSKYHKYIDDIIRKALIK